MCWCACTASASPATSSDPGGATAARSSTSRCAWSPRRGCGAIVYLCGHEGRGIGIAHKLRAYELQDQGLDTVDANLELGLPVDTRDYGIGAAILHDLGVGRIRLLTNNPAKVSGLTAFGVDVAERVPLVTTVHEDNAAYLQTKRDRLGHRYEAD